MKIIDKSEIQKTIIIKNGIMTTLSCALLLNGCAATSNVIPDSLPPIREETTQQALPTLPSKNEYFDSLGAGVKTAMIAYEKTHIAPVFETSQGQYFPFNEVTPMVTCSPLHTCDIALEASERVTGVYPGDTARWLFELAQSGNKSQSQPHVIFKPKAADIETNAIVTTDERTYHINLISKDNAKRVPINFYYPENIESSWQQFVEDNKAKRKEARLSVINSTQSFNLSQLDFNYKIGSRWNASKPSWSPIRAFNDGEKVYLQMPGISKRGSLPALYINDNNQVQLVNFRVKSPYYIVDRLFQKSVMVNGTGSEAESVTISYQGDRYAR